MSHQTIASLITYIYCGEVNIEFEHLEEFRAIVKAFQIKGFDTDGNSKLISSRTTQATTSNEQNHRSKRIQHSEPLRASKRLRLTSDLSDSSDSMTSQHRESSGPESLDETSTNNDLDHDDEFCSYTDELANDDLNNEDNDSDDEGWVDTETENDGSSNSNEFAANHPQSITGS